MAPKIARSPNAEVRGYVRAKLLSLRIIRHSTAMLASQ